MMAGGFGFGVGLMVVVCLLGLDFGVYGVVELLLSGGFWVFVFPMVLRNRFGLHLRCLSEWVCRCLGGWGVWLVNFGWCFGLISVVFASGYC